MAAAVYSEPHVLSVSLVGNSGVGKTCLILRITRDIFPKHTSPTLGLEFHKQPLHVEDSLVELMFWDTAGEERFHSVLPTHFRRADAVLVVYEVSSIESHRAVPMWVELARQYSPEHTVIIVLANKSDLMHTRMVTESQGRSQAISLECAFFEVSAATGTGVSVMMEHLVQALFVALDDTSHNPIGPHLSLAELPVDVEAELPDANGGQQVAKQDGSGGSCIGGGC